MSEIKGSINLQIIESKKKPVRIDENSPAAAAAAAHSLAGPSAILPAAVAVEPATVKPPKTCWQRFLSFWRHLTLEPAYMMFAMGMGIYYIVAWELYIEKVCRVNLNYTDEICDNIHDHEEEQVHVQKYVSTLQIYSTVLQAIPGEELTMARD